MESYRRFDDAKTKGDVKVISRVMTVLEPCVAVFCRQTVVHLLSSDNADQEINGTLQVSKAVTGSGLSKMFKEKHVVAI